MGKQMRSGSRVPDYSLLIYRFFHVSIFAATPGCVILPRYCHRRILKLFGSQWLLGVTRNLEHLPRAGWGGGADTAIRHWRQNKWLLEWVLVSFHKTRKLVLLWGDYNVIQWCLGKVHRAQAHNSLTGSLHLILSPRYNLVYWNNPIY